MLKCITCNKKLVGKQAKFCSSKCKNDGLQNYAAQQARGRRRRFQLIDLHGGCCSECGYKKNASALSFHHVSKKNFKLDLRSLSNRSWKASLEESKLCILLCHNCHMELHNPSFAML